MAPPSELLDSNTASSLTYLHIPDMLVDWPWQRNIKPHYEELVAESDTWFRAFLPFKSPKSHHAFERCGAGLFIALTHPDVPANQFRTCVDLTNILFLIDEYTDVEPAPRVREIVDICIDAVHNPSKPRPDGEVVLGEMVRQFWEQGQRTITHQTGGPFVASFIDYLHGVVANAEARDGGRILTAEAYRAIRLKDVGVEQYYTLWGVFHSIPDHLYDNPLLVRMSSLCCEMISNDNDLVSYNREQMSGNGDFNIIKIIMHHNGLSLDDAVRLLVEQNTQLATEYMQCHHELRATLEGQGSGVETSLILRYLDHIGNFRRASWCWSFECGRYFGERGSTCAKTQMVPLVPKKIRDRNLRENQIQVVLMEEELAML